MRKLLLIFTALLLFSSCSESEPESANLYLAAYREYDADGSITLSRSYDVDGNLLAKSDERSTVVYTYSADGSIAREDRYADREGEELVSYTLYTRDADTVEQKTFDADGGLIGWVDTKYDEQGRRIAEIIRDPSTGEEEKYTSIFHTETENSFIEQHYVDYVLVYQYTESLGWDDVGAVVSISEYRRDIGTRRTTTYYEDTDIVEVEYHGFGTFQSREEYIYDKNGRLSETHIINTYGRVMKTTTFTYDDHGNLVLEETTLPDGTLESGVEYVYLEIPE